eukprot:s2345_g2.t1
MAETGKKNVLFFFMGSRGDVMPAIPICKALEDRGHKATIAATPGHEASIRAYGVRCVTVGQTRFRWRDDSAIMSEEELKVMRSLDTTGILKVLDKHGPTWNTEDAVPEAARDVAEFVDSEKIDVLVSTFLTSIACARIALARPGLSYIGTTFTFGFGSPPTSAYPPGGYEMASWGFLNKLKHFHYNFCRLIPFVVQAKFIQRTSERLLEIPNVDHTDGFAFFGKLQSFPQLGMWSESIMQRPLDFPKNFEVTGCVFIPRIEGWQPSEALSAFVSKKDASGLPPIAVTFGSVMGARRLGEVIIAAARQLGKSVIWCHDAKREGQAETTDFSFAMPCDGQATAEDVFEIEYVPFDWLLPRVSVTVCHGGAGTLWQSFRSGTPCVVCPLLSALFADQVPHADFVERAGLGSRVLEMDPSIEACKEALLAAQSCSAACQQIATKLQQEDGSVKAAAAIERISAEKEAAQHPKTAQSNGCYPCF